MSLEERKAARLSVLEAVAYVLARNARHASMNSTVSMLAVDIGRDLQNFVPQEEINEFFNMFQRAKDIAVRG